MVRILPDGATGSLDRLEVRADGRERRAGDQARALAERTGLNDSRAYRQVRADLTRVRAVGFSSSGRQGNTTAEIRFDIS